jgi:cation diffusion facilitator family transporter
MFVSITVNITLVFIKLIMGIISNYKSLVADAIHSFSDLSTDVVAIFGQRMASKKEDQNHPFGHGKIEYITSIIIGVFIMVLGINMISSTINGEIVETKYRNIALIAVFITIILKYLLAQYVYKMGQKLKNNILIAGSKENMSDVLSASSVFVAILLSMFQHTIPIFRYTDKIAGIIISLLIIKTSFYILKDNINTIIGECERDENIISNIKHLITTVPDVISIDNLIIMKFGSYYQIMLDAGVNNDFKLKEAHDVAHNIEKELLSSDLRIKYVVVHINPCEKKC